MTKSALFDDGRGLFGKGWSHDSNWVEPSMRISFRKCWQLRFNASQTCQPFASLAALFIYFIFLKEGVLVMGALRVCSLLGTRDLESL